MTSITFHLARALGRTWQSGDEIVVTELDHHANVAPWRALESDRAVQVRSARMDPQTGTLDYEHLAELTGKKTRLVAIGAASNSLGTINDLFRARDIARSVGALLFVDAVHLAPHQLIDVQAIGCDFLACSAYKFYGPHIGILFAREALLSSLPFPKLDPAPDTAPERVETGTQNQEGIAGVSATVDFLAGLADNDGSRRERLTRVFSELHSRGDDQTHALWDGLSAMARVRLYGPSPSERRTPTVAFTVEGKSSAEVARALAEAAIFASHGDFYAPTVIERLGVEGLVRVGCGCYTSDEEIARLLDVICNL